MTASDGALERRGSMCVVAGLLLLPTAAGLFVSGTGRSVAAGVAPVGLASLVLGIALLQGVKAPRWLIVAMIAAVTCAAAAVVIWFWSTTRPATVVY